MLKRLRCRVFGHKWRAKIAGSICARCDHFRYGVFLLALLALSGCGTTGHEVNVGGALGPSVNLGWKGPQPQGEIMQMVSQADAYEFEIRGRKGQMPTAEEHDHARTYAKDSAP